MPKLIRLYITQVIVGFMISAIFVALLLWFDVAGLRGLVAGSDSGVMAVFLLWFMNGIVFAGVQFAWKIMSMAEKPQGPRRGTPVVDQFKPARVRQEARARH